MTFLNKRFDIFHGTPFGQNTNRTKSYPHTPGNWLVCRDVELTVEHVDEYGSSVRVARLARVVAGVGQPGLGDQQPAGGARLGLLRLQADAAAAAWRVEVHHLGALEPHHRAGRRRVHVHRAREADGAALLHVHLRGPLDVCLSGCTDGGGRKRKQKKKKQPRKTGSVSAKITDHLIGICTQQLQGRNVKISFIFTKCAFHARPRFFRNLQYTGVFRNTRGKS